MFSWFNVGIAELAVWHEIFCTIVDPSTLLSSSEPNFDDGMLQCSVSGQCSLPDDAGLTEGVLV